MKALYLLIAIVLVASSPAVASQDAANDPAPANGWKQRSYACSHEADWLVVRTSGYRFGNERQRTQLRNHPPRTVRQWRSLCFAMSRSTPERASGLAEKCTALLAGIGRNGGGEAESHLRRMAPYCERPQAAF